MGAPKPPVTSWSFSILKDYEACPYRVYLKRVERAPEPDIDPEAEPNHPLIRGDRVHKEAEAYIRGDAPLTHDLRRVIGRLNELREKHTEGTIEVEQRWGFDENWNPVDWSSDEIWLRVICDVVEHVDLQVVVIDDWKTGKSFGNELKHTQQKQLYGLATLMRYPTREIAQVNMQYVDEGKRVPSRYDRSMLPALLQSWTDRAKRLTGSLTFPPKPNRGNCRYCPFARQHGTGVCPYDASGD